MKTVSIFLMSTTFLTGLLGGIGFTNLAGFIPAMRLVPANQFVRFWQILDSYMSVRMPIFVSIILASGIVSIILVNNQPVTLPLLWLILALVIILADFIVAVSYNLPANRLMQSITPETIPANFEYYRNKAIFGFTVRAFCMMGSFACSLTATFLQGKNGMLH